MALIFRQLIREENFDNMKKQEQIINHILVEMYPKEVKTREKVAYPAMVHALSKWVDRGWVGVRGG